MAAVTDLGLLRDLVSRLYREEPGWLPDLSTTVTDAIHDGLPDLDRDRELRRGTYASTESVIRLFIEMTISDRPMGEAEPPPAAAAYAQEFVRRGLGLDILLRTYFVGHGIFFDDWIGRVRALTDDAALQLRAFEEGAAASFEFIQAVTGRLVRRYESERERWVRSAAAVRAETLRSLLADETIDLSSAEARLRYRLDRSHLGFVVWSEDEIDTGTGLAALEGAGASLAEALGSSEPLLVPIGPNLLAGWIPGTEPPPDVASLAGLPHDRAAAAVGSPGEGIEGFRRTHREALHARRVAQLLSSDPIGTTLFSDVALVALATSDPTLAREFVDSMLGGLRGEDDETRRLAATLRAYLECGSSPRRAGARLGIHENTVKNRVAAAKERLTRPLEPNASEVLVALRLLPAFRDHNP
jgi:DNA-binding PucR family transcriptional regulator